MSNPFIDRYTCWGAVAVLIGIVAESPCGAAPVDFAHQVVPILRKHCMACHGGKESEGEFSINTRERLLAAEVVRPGETDGSRLLDLIQSSDPDDQMPPKDRARMSAEEIDIVRRWVVEGLNWQEGFSFAPSGYEPPLKPRRPELPPPTDGRMNPIDRIVDAHLTQHQISRPIPISDGQFLRRVSLDLIGLLPPVEQVTAFEQDTAPDKREKMIDHLLTQQEAYAAHWLTFWNDLLRNAYSGTGYIDGGRTQITEWLFQALYANRPYDEFVRQLVAPVPGSEGFVNGIKWRGNVNASQTREVQFAQNIGQVFLGINMKCASCHDSFIDRWTLAETYGLSAIYAQEPLQIHRCDKAQGKNAVAAWIFPELGQIDPAAPQPARLRQLAALLTHPENGRLTRTIANRLWHRLMGRGIVHPVDAMHAEPWNVDLLDYLAVYTSDQSYDLKKLLRLIATSQAYQSHAVVEQAGTTESASYRYAGPIAKRMTAEQFFDAMWSITRTWPQPIAEQFQRDGRNQGGQLRDLLVSLAPASDLAGLKPEELLTRWGDRPLRAAFTPLDPLQARLGRPIREQVVTSRPDEFTTLEAIALANGGELAKILQQGATNLLAQQSAETLVDHLYRAALARAPSAEEKATCQEILPTGGTASAVEDLLWTLFLLPEFQIIQ